MASARIALLQRWELGGSFGGKLANLHRWVNEIRDPGAEMVIQLRDALHEIDPAAEDFVKLYLGQPGDDRKSDF